MINQLKNDLEILEKNNKLAKYKIANLFYNLEEAANTFNNNIVFKNPFATLRVEISEKIFDFLDTRSVLTFRFTCKLGNTLILLLLQKKLIKLYHRKEIFQQNMEQLKKENETINYQEANHLQQYFWRESNAIQELNAHDIYELKSFQNPPQLVVKILELFSIVLDCTQCDSWNNSKQLLGKILESPYRYIVALVNYDVTTITEEQLLKLQEIHQINIQPELIGLRALRVFYQYILAIVKLRELKQIQVLSKLKWFEKFIGYISRDIYNIKRILS